MPGRSPYRDCIFDLYGTLVDIHTDEDSPALWAELAAFYTRHGAPYDPAQLHGRYRASVAEAEAGKAPLRHDAHEAHPEIRLEEVFLRLFRARGAAAELPLALEAARLFRRASTEYIRLYDGADRLLGALRAAGQRVWLLTNAQGCFTRPELDALGLSPYFDGVYISSDHGCKKPDPRFFRILLEERSIDPAGAVMVGNDGVCDIQGAQAVGLSTLYIRSNLSPDEPLPPAQYVIPEMDLEAVRRVLQGG